MILQIFKEDAWRILATFPSAPPLGPVTASQLPVRLWDAAAERLLAASGSAPVDPDPYGEVIDTHQVLRSLILIKGKDALSHEPDPFAMAMQQPRVRVKARGRHPRFSVN